MNSLGKFENTPSYTSYFWKLSLEHSDDILVDDNEIYHYFIDLIDTDYEDYNISRDFKQIELWEDDNGFVYSVLRKNKISVEE